MSEFELVCRSQAGADVLLRELGALDQLRDAVVSYCVDSGVPAPPYKPQEIKKRLRVHGWLPEVRVPPLNPKHDQLPVNDRYDLWKDFAAPGEHVGVAIEIERWAIWNDLLKFRRGLNRGQIRAGIVLHDHPQHLDYVFNHLRLMVEPVFDDIPILFAAPSGGALPEPYERKRNYQPYRMPSEPR